MFVVGCVCCFCGGCVVFVPLRLLFVCSICVYVVLLYSFRLGVRLCVVLCCVVVVLSV